jgi:putative membrane protein
MMMGVGMIGMVAFWALLIWGAVYLASRVTPPDAPHTNSALDILEQRFARGEIDRDELETRRGTLQGS